MMRRLKGALRLVCLRYRQNLFDSSESFLYYFFAFFNAKNIILRFNLFNIFNIIVFVNYNIKELNKNKEWTNITQKNIFLSEGEYDYF